MIIILGIILFGFCLAGWKFIGRLVGVIGLAVLLLIILCKVVGIF
jgi:hypothetical protein